MIMFNSGKKELKNADIRRYARKKQVRMYEIADALGVCEMTLFRKLRYDLTEPDKEQLYNLIDRLSCSA